MNNKNNENDNMSFDNYMDANISIFEFLSDIMRLVFDIACVAAVTWVLLTYSIPLWVEVISFAFLVIYFIWSLTGFYYNAVTMIGSITLLYLTYYLDMRSSADQHENQIDGKDVFKDINEE